MNNKDNKINDVNTKSEQVQDIIDRMPTGWTVWVFSILSVLIIVVCILSFVIRYPDTVDGEVTITSSTAPVRLVALSSGRLHLIKATNEMVDKGTLLAYIESGVDLEAYHYLNKLSAKGITDSLPAVPSHLNFGELGNSLNAYFQGLNRWLILKHSQQYKLQRQTLQEQIKTSRVTQKHIQEVLKLKEKVQANVREQFKKDSILYTKGELISQVDYQNKENTYLSAQESLLKLRQSLQKTVDAIHQAEIQLTRLKVEEEDKLREVYTVLQSQFNNLNNALRVWEERYVFKAPISGVLDYLGFWKEDFMIKSGTEVFSIIPQKGAFRGEAIIPSIGAGKIHIGQDVNIKLNDFPYDEYGLIKGKVVSMSKLTNKLETPRGAIDAYRVIIDLPNGIKTNFDTELTLGVEAKGRAEIITKPKRLISRLFDNLKAKGSK